MVATLLIWITVNSSSQGPIPAPAKAAQGHQDQTNKVRGEAGANEQITSTTPPASAQPDAVVTTRNQGDRGSVKKSHPATNGWEIVGTVAGVVNTVLLTFFSGALAWLAYRQWRAMDRQAKLMHRQAVWMGKQFGEMKSSGTDTHDVAVAATKSADAAERGATAAEQTLNKVERAYLTIRFQARQMADLGLHEPSITISFFVTNSGHTLAKITGITVHAVDAVQWPQTPNYNLPSRVQSVSGAAVPPTQQVEVSFSFTSNEVGHILNFEPEHRMHIFGKILYDDIFGKSHFVQFGRKYVPEDLANPFHYPNVLGYEDSD